MNCTSEKGDERTYQYYIKFTDKNTRKREDIRVDTVKTQTKITN